MDEAVAAAIATRQATCVYVANARLASRVEKYTGRGFTFAGNWRERHEDEIRRLFRVTSAEYVAMVDGILGLTITGMRESC